MADYSNTDAFAFPPLVLHLECGHQQHWRKYGLHRKKKPPVVGKDASCYTCLNLFKYAPIEFRKICDRLSPS